MIAQSITVVSKLINEFLKIKTGNRVDVIQIGDLGKVESLSNHVNLSLVNIEEENTGKISLGRKSGFELTQQSQTYNLSILLSSHYASDAYLEGVDMLGEIMGLMKHNAVITRDQYDLPDGLERILMEQVNINTVDLMAIWQANKAKYKPSLVYRLRIVCWSDASQQEIKGIV